MKLEFYKAIDEAKYATYFLKDKQLITPKSEQWWKIKINLMCRINPKALDETGNYLGYNIKRFFDRYFANEISENEFKDFIECLKDNKEYDYPMTLIKGSWCSNKETCDSNAVHGISVYSNKFTDLLKLFTRECKRLKNDKPEFINFVSYCKEMLINSL